MNLTRDEFFEIIHALEDRKETLKTRFERFARDERYAADAQSVTKKLDTVASALNKIEEAF